MSLYSHVPPKIINYSENARFDILTAVLLKFKSSGTQHCAMQHAVPDVLKDNTASIAHSYAQIMLICMMCAHSGCVREYVIHMYRNFIFSSKVLEELAMYLNIIMVNYFICTIFSFKKTVMLADNG
jgi:hypothetical protein